MDVFSEHFTSASFYPFTGPSTQFSTVATDRGGDECDDDYDMEAEPCDQGVDGRQVQPQQPEAPSSQQPRVPESQEDTSSSSAPLDGDQTTPAPLGSTGVTAAMLTPTEEQPLGTLGSDLGTETRNLESGFGADQCTQDSGFGGSDPRTLDSEFEESDQPTLDSGMESEPQSQDSVLGSETQSDSHTPAPPPEAPYNTDTQLLPSTNSLEPGVAVTGHVSATDSSPEPRMLSDTSSAVTAPIPQSDSIPQAHSDSSAATESHSSSSIPPQQPPSVPASQPEQAPELQPSGSAIPALIPENMSMEVLHQKVKKLFPSFKPQGILRFSRSVLGTLIHRSPASSHYLCTPRDTSDS